MGGRLIKYHAMLIGMPKIVLKTCQTLNPATLKPGADHCTSIEHNCSEVIDIVYCSQPELRCPYWKYRGNWFINGNSFMEKRGKKNWVCYSQDC